MHSRSKHLAKLKRHLKLKDILAGIFVILFAGIGTYMLLSGHAANAPGSSSVAPNFYGMNWHPIWINPGGQDAEMDLMQQAGIKSVRIDAEWYFMEQSKGVYQSTYMSRLDYAVNGLLARGIDPLIVVTSTPQWVTGAPATDPDPAHEPPLRTTVDPACNPSQTICGTYNRVQDYNNFLTYLIRRWAGKVKEYEIWNEPNGNWSWRRTETDWQAAATNVGTDYATLLKSAYAAAKAADPSVIVLGGSLANTDGPNQLVLKAIYAQGAKNSFDILSQHYYCDPPSHNWCNSNRSIIDPETVANTFTTNIAPIMQANGDGSKPVWVTETGYTTINSGGVSEAQQADFLVRSYNKAKTMPNVARVYPYEMDSEGTGTNPESYYGIIHATMHNANSLPADTRIKPAYTALKQLTYVPPPPATTPANTGANSTGSSQGGVSVNKPSTSSQTPASNPKAVSKVVYKVDGKVVSRQQATAAQLSNGRHTIEEIITDPTGQTTVKKRVLNVNNRKGLDKKLSLYTTGQKLGVVLVITALAVVAVWQIRRKRHVTAILNYPTADPRVIIRPTKFN